MGSFIVFAILAVLAIGSAVGMVLSRNAIHSALFLIGTMAVLAVFYVLLNAPFVAMVQVAVYAGAIMVLFLFVIMLLGAERLGGIGAGSRWQIGLAMALGAALLVILGIALFSGGLTAGDPAVVDAGPAAFGLRLFEAYLLPFEVTSILLLVAMIGVVVLRTREGKK